MVMATQTTTTHADLTAPGVEAWMEEEAKLYKPIFPNVFMQETTSRLYEDDSSVAGVDFPEEVSQAAASPEDSLQLGYTWRYEQKIFKRKVAVSKLLEDTDLYGIEKAEGRAKELSRKAAQGRDVEAFSVFRRGFDSTKTYGDGMPLISVQHPRKDGGTAQRNTFLDGVQRVLSYDNVKLMEDVLIEVYSNSGIPIDVALNGKLVLMVTPYNREAALQIAQTGDGRPGEADWGVNYYEGRNLDVIVNPYLSHRYAYKKGETTSTDRETYDQRWFLMDAEYAKKNLKFKQLQDFAVNAWGDEDTDVMYAKVRDVFAVGISGWYGIAGSLGDGTTYSS